MKERMWRMERFASLSTLASGLHHEIKNPITALSIHVQLLEERLRDPSSTEPVDEMIGVLKSEVRRLDVTLESFRNFASLQRPQSRQVDVRDRAGGRRPPDPPPGDPAGRPARAHAPPRRSRCRGGPRRRRRSSRPCSTWCSMRSRRCPTAVSWASRTSVERRGAPGRGLRHGAGDPARRSGTTSSTPTSRRRIAGPAWA